MNPSQEALAQNPVTKTAVLSEDGVYRYELTRTWRPDCAKMVFCMLNPSTADHTVDDPTIRRCMAFAAREGYGGIIVVNLFARRATNPVDLKGHTDKFNCGPDNHKHITEAMKYAHRWGAHFVCAWGANRAARYRWMDIGEMAAHYDVPLWQLNQPTQQGFPRHPLYLPSDAPLTVFQP